MSSNSSIIPNNEQQRQFGHLKNDEDDGTNDTSDQSSSAAPVTARVLETSSSSVASSPRVHTHKNKVRHHDEGGTASGAIDDPSKVSWESGTVSSKSPSRVTVKLLVSNNMAGSIIGRAGQTISDLQQQSSARIRLSQSGDYFPGTSDRICLIHGSVEHVKTGIALVLGKLYELQLELVDTQLAHAEAGDEDGSNAENDDSREKDTKNPVKINFMSRILIPSAACGMLIGREGGTIKKLKESADASSVRLSPKVTDHSAPRTFERILTVSGTELISCVSFSQAILDGFVRHPEICRYLNSTTSYSRSSNVPYPSVPRNSTVPSYSSSTSSVPNTSRQQAFAQPHAPSHNIESGIQALAFDAQANVQSTAHNPRQPAYINSPNHNAGNIVPPTTAQVSVFHPPGSALQQQTTPTPSPYGSTVNLAVPDSVIGAILGRRGQTLRDLQDESGARIKVSQRDEFIPGTNNRIVTISGPEESIATARNLILRVLSRNP